MHGFDTGNTGFMLVATSLVMLMTPGLAFFYGGLVGRKNVLAIMIQSFVSMGVTTDHLVRLRLLAVLQRRRRAASSATSTWPSCAASTSTRPVHGDGNIPLFVFIAYQMMFAIITPALITGAFANRVRFTAYLIFLVAWLLLRLLPRSCTWSGAAACWRSGACSTSPAASSVHAIAGMAALASVFFVGERKVDRQRAAQHPAGRPGHRPALVRLVRLQRRQRAAGRRGHRARLPQHRHRRLVRRPSPG